MLSTSASSPTNPTTQKHPVVSRARYVLLVKKATAHAPNSWSHCDPLHIASCMCVGGQSDLPCDKACPLEREDHATRKSSYKVLTG